MLYSVNVILNVPLKESFCILREKNGKNILHCICEHLMMFTDGCVVRFSRGIFQYCYCRSHKTTSIFSWNPKSLSLKCVKRTVYFDLQAGSSWVANCTRFDCMETAVGAVVLASGVVCPPFNDTECIQVWLKSMHSSSFSGTVCVVVVLLTSVHCVSEWRHSSNVCGRLL